MQIWSAVASADATSLSISWAHSTKAPSPLGSAGALKTEPFDLEVRIRIHHNSFGGQVK